MNFTKFLLILLLSFLLMYPCCIGGKIEWNDTICQNRGWDKCNNLNIPYENAEPGVTNCAAACVIMWCYYDGIIASAPSQLEVMEFMGGGGPVVEGVQVRRAVDHFTYSSSLLHQASPDDREYAKGILAAVRFSLILGMPSIFPMYQGYHALILSGFCFNWDDVNFEFMIYRFKDPNLPGSENWPSEYTYEEIMDIYWTPSFFNNMRECIRGYARSGNIAEVDPMEELKQFYRYNGTYYGGPASYIPEGSEFVRISYPIGTNELYLGQQKNIEWESNGLSGNIKLELLKGDTYWGTIATGLPLQQGSYSWTVGQYQGGTATVGDDYKIKITMMDGSDYDTSNVDFSSNEGDVPGNPPLISPAENAEVCTTTPTFKWSAVTATPVVDYYQVQINIVTTIGEPSTKLYVSANLTDASFTVPTNILESGKNYKWFVRAHNAVGWGEWSGRNLSISVFSVPDVPVLNSPANNATVCTTRPTFKWEAVAATCPAVDYYQVQINIITTLGEPSTKLYVSANITGTSYTLPANILEGGKNYKWFVRAHNAEGWGEWSGRNINITVFTVPVNPILNSPADNATISSTRPTFIWSAISACPALDYYQVQVNIVPASGGPSTKLYVSANLTATSFTMPANILESGKKYKWFVRAHNSEGWGGWSGRNIIIQ